MRIISSVTFMLMTAQLLCADGTKDNVPDNVRPVPPAGIEVNATDRAELNEGLFQLGERIKQLRASNDDRVRDLLPDVEIFHRAVEVALADNELHQAEVEVLIDAARRLDVTPQFVEATLNRALSGLD